MTFRKNFIQWLIFSALVMTVLLICFEFVSLHEAFARAGGGGGGGGSSSSSSSSGSSGTSTTSNLLTIFSALLGSLLAAFHVVLINRKINTRKKQISATLQQMRQLEPEWNESRLEEQARLKFKLLQDAWSQQDLDVLKRNLTSDLYPRWEAQIQDLKVQNMRNVVEQIEILNVRFVAVQNFIDNQKDTFTVCIDAKCTDVMFHSEMQNDYKIKSRTKDKFREFWTFERDRGEWKLKAVWQWSTWSKFLNSEIVYELANGVKPGHASASFQQIDLETKKTQSGKTNRVFTAATVTSVILLGVCFSLIEHVNPLDSLLKICIYSLPLLFLSYIALRKKLFQHLENINADLSKFSTIISLSIITIFTSTSTVIILLNFLADRQPALTLTQTINQKYIRKYKATRSYIYVVTSPLDEKCCIIPAESLPLSTSWDKYDEIEVGKSKAKLTIKKGLLGIPYLRSSEIIPLTPEEKKSTSTSASKELKRKTARQWSPDALAAIAWNAEPIIDAPTDFRFVHWSINQMKSKEPLVNGQVHGMAEFRYPNGQLYGMIPFKNGQKHGRFTLYREDGSLDQQLSYKEGVLHGLCRWYKPDGLLLQEAVYVDGQHTNPQ